MDPFITVSDLSNFLGKDLSADPGATAAVDAACDVCREIAEQNFNKGTTTIFLDGTNSDALVLPQGPVGTVSSVSVNGTLEDEFCWTEDGMLFRGSAGLRTSASSVWPAGRLNISVTYVHGYETLEVPGAVCKVALYLAARQVAQGLVSSESVGDVTANYAVSAADLSSNEERILKHYRQERSF